MNDKSRAQKVAELALEDQKLPEICFSTRPLYDAPGVLVSIEDASQRPYERIFTGRVNAAQALGLAADLLLMLEIQITDDTETPDYDRARQLRFVRQMLEALDKRDEGAQS